MVCPAVRVKGDINYNCLLSRSLMIFGFITFHKTVPILAVPMFNQVGPFGPDPCGACVCQIFINKLKSTGPLTPAACGVYVRRVTLYTGNKLV